VLARAACALPLIVQLSTACRAGGGVDDPALPDAPRAIPQPAPAPASLLGGGGRLSAADRALGLAWKFRAGAPVVGTPALAPGGRVYVGTNEGYVHALDANGAFAWSYTLAGSVAGELAVGRRGVVHVATRVGLIYALQPDGTLLWKFACPSPPVTGLRSMQSGAIVYGARDGRVVAVSSAGRLLWAITADGSLQAGPTRAPWGAVLFAGRRTLVIRESARVKHVALFDEPVQTDPLGWDRNVSVVTRTGLVTLSREGSRRWQLPGVQYAAAVGQGLVVVRPGELGWVNAAGRVERRVPLAQEVSAEPCSDGQGTVFVPTVQGLLLRVPAGGEPESLTVAHSALLRPACGRSGPLAAVAAAEDGTVVGVRPHGQRSPLRQDRRIR
jgi:hypothetical protein